MKKIFILLSLLFSLFICNAQIIISHSSLNSKVSQYYVETNNYALSSPSYGVSLPDANTKIYVCALKIGQPSDRIFIVRKNNKWQIELIDPNQNVYLLFKQVGTSTSSFLNCAENLKWEKWEGNNGPFGSSPSFGTNQIDSTLRISGNCKNVSQGSSSSEILPNSLNLPKLSSTEISNLLDPAQGSLVFDIDEQNVKVFTHLGWDKLVKDEYMDFTPKIDYTVLSTSYGGLSGPGVEMGKSIQVGDDIYCVVSGGMISLPGGGSIILNGGVNVYNQTHIVKFDNNLLATSLLNLGKLTYTGLSYYNNTLFITGNISTPTVINGQTYNPIDGNGIFLIAYDLVNSNIKYVKILNTLFQENLKYILSSNNGLYAIGVFKNNGKNNGFIKKINPSNGNLDKLTRFIGNSNNEIYSYYLDYSSLYVAGYAESNFTLIGNSNVVNNTLNMPRRAFVHKLNLNTLEPDATSFVNIHDELQNGNLIPSNLENVSYNMGGVFSNTLRMSLGSSAIKSSVNGKLAYSGSYIVSLDVNNLNRMVSIEPYSYMNIGYLKGNKMISYFKNSIIYTGRSKYFNSASGADILSIINPRGQIEKLIYSTTSQNYFNISNVFQNGNDLLIMGGSGSPFTMFNQSLGSMRASIAAFKVKF